MGDLGLEMQGNDDVGPPEFSSCPRGCETPSQLLSLALLCLQSHYAQQARQSRSVARKRKREPSAPPTSKVRSQSASRPPRDQSGLRDAKVGDSRILLLFIFTLSIPASLRGSVSPSDGKEGQEDHEKLPERHQPSGKEGRSRSTRV